MSLLPDYIANVRCFIDYSIQFLGGVDQSATKSYIFSEKAKSDFKFQFIPSMVAKNVDT
jgi:hypothetical protein